MKDFLHDNKRYYNPIEFAMAHIGGTWKMPILLCLREGALRYGELRSSIPHITDKMLYTQLRELEGKGMIVRRSFLEKPPRVEYALTEKARQAFTAIDALESYGVLLMAGSGITPA